MTKNSALLILPGIPYPPTDGFKIKASRTIETLDRYYNLKVIIISTKKITLEEKTILASKRIDFVLFDIKFVDRIISTFKTLLNKLPFQVNLYSVNSVHQYLERENDFDVICLNLVRTAVYMKHFDRNKVFVDMVDVISINYKKSAKTTTSLVHKFFYKFEYKRLEVFEKEVFRTSKCTWLVSPIELIQVRQYGNVQLNTNGVKNELIEMPISNSIANRIIFFGAMFYQPNIDAVLWFVDNVWNKIDSDLTFEIIGTKPSKKLIRQIQNRNNIIVKGYMQDAFEYISDSLLVVAPMISGGGVQNKIIECMGLGKIVLTGDSSAAAIQGAKHMHNIIVCKDIVDYTYWINEINRNYSSYQHIGINAKRLIREYFSWKNYEKKLVSDIERFA
jgi:glycosyltransferase involved in cell wall biosynthesis